MPVINSIVRWLNLKRLHQIDLFRKYPDEVQKEMLFQLLRKAENTEWGIQHGFKDITSLKQFQERNPVQKYEEVSPFVKRIMNGKQNVLWPSEVKWFARSSGTTGEKSKFIPVTYESLEECHYRGGKDILAFYFSSYPDTAVLTGKSLTLGGSHQINPVGANSYYGDLSAILIDNLPFWADLIKTPPQEIALMAKWEEKLEKLSSVTVSENVTSIAGVPSWMLVLLRYILEKTGKKTIPEVWPNLELFVHGGVSFRPYRDQYFQLIPSKKMHYMETYNASEGFFAIQDDPLRDDLLLMLDYGIFYEFIPVDQLNSGNAKAYTIGEVETGKNYAMVISTNGGLWRYLLGDTIQFTSLYPHKIKITGRTKLYLNVFGEEIVIENAEKAVEDACRETGAVITEYTAGPVYMEGNRRGRHEWLIECECLPSDRELFAKTLDKTLQAVNSDYEAKRYHDITLEPPLIRFVAKGTFYEWMRRTGRLGGQNKVPRLWNDRKYIDELTEIHMKISSGGFWPDASSTLTSQEN